MITLDLSILNQKGTPMFYSDTLALRPAFGIVGRIFIDTASPYGIYRDTGSAWVQIAGGGGSGTITGSGTATQIAYFDAATNLTSSSNLFWDNTNGRIGINTATPGASIDAHGTGGTIIQANSTTLANSLMSFQLQGTGKWQIGNFYSAGLNYFRLFDQLNSTERIKVQNTGQIDTTGWFQNTNTIAGITGTSPTALTSSLFINYFTYNSGISTSASVNTIGLIIQNTLNYSGANTINNTSYNTSALIRNAVTFGSAGASITYSQATGFRALSNDQVQYIQEGTNNGTISHYANILITGDGRISTGTTTFTNRYQILLNDLNELSANNTYTNRWAIYQAGSSENNFFAGKVGIGSGYTPSTFAFDVNGDSVLRGSGTTSATSSLSLRNSASTQLYNFRNNGTFIFGNLDVGIYQSNDKGTNVVPGAGGLFLGYFATGDLAYANVPSVTLGRPNNRLLNGTSGTGTQIMASVVGNYSPTSGTGLFTAFEVVPTINQTGGASGITRGLNVNPTLTASANWRSIETSNNTGYSAYFGGSANLFFNDSADFEFGSTTGSIIATSAEQKISFWGKTPIIQPTTAITAAAFVANTSLIANDTATYGGYTLGQVVQALRNAGLLA